MLPKTFSDSARILRKSEVVFLYYFYLFWYNSIRLKHKKQVHNNLVLKYFLCWAVHGVTVSALIYVWVGMCEMIHSVHMSTDFSLFICASEEEIIYDDANEISQHAF